METLTKLINQKSSLFREIICLQVELGNLDNTPEKRHFIKSEIVDLRKVMFLLQTEINLQLVNKHNNVS